MESMTSEHITVMFLSLGVLLGMARLLGEIARKFNQPSIVGELLAGVLLGPTVLGQIAPDLMHHLFPTEGPNAIALEAITTLAIALFLLVAGIEVDLSTIWRQGRIGTKIGLASVVIPFTVGLICALLFPDLFGRHEEAEPLTFALFFATALSISALPVIAKTLMDMGLYRSDLGMVVISVAVFNDLVGWIIFAILLGMMDAGSHANSVGVTIALTLAFAGFMLTFGRWMIHHALPFLQAYTQWPAGVLGFALTLTLLGAAVTEWIGIHAIFGAFLVGVAFGDSSYLRERTRVTIEHFISFIFAPLFFASIGLKVNFFANFDALLVVSVLLIACACKLIGGYAGARWGAMSRRESMAIGFAVNSRGAMEIILGLLALEAGFIRDRLFVALVIMAIVTSMISGPGMRMILRPTRKRRLHDAMSARHFIRELQGSTRREAIRELIAVVSETTGLGAATLEQTVWAREAILSTGIGHGVALPHARVEGIQEPIVATGISDSGIDFDSPDGKPAHVIFLLLTPTDDSTAQLELLAEVSWLFANPNFLGMVLGARNYTDFLALMKSVPFDFAHASPTPQSQS